MKLSYKAKQIIVWGSALLPLIVILIAYSSLPDQIPKHWDASGNVTYADRWIILPMAALAPIVTALMFLTRRIDPKRENYNRFSASYELFIVLFNLFMLCMILFVIVESLRPGTLEVQTFILVLVGILIAVSGNMMPKFKHNYFIGIKTPWTLASKTVWYHTHRLGGFLWVIGGLGFIISAFLPSAIAYPLILIDCAVIILVPYITSYLFFKKERSK